MVTTPSRSVVQLGTRRGADGHPDAGHRRHRGHPSDPLPRWQRDSSARAHHVRPRRVRLRGDACRRQRVPHQGCTCRGARPRDPHRGRQGCPLLADGACAGCSTASWPGVRLDAGTPPELSALTERELEVLKPASPAGCRTPRSPQSCSSVTTPSRPTSRTCSRSSGYVTASRPSSSPTSAVWSSQVGPCLHDDRPQGDPGPLPPERPRRDGLEARRPERVRRPPAVDADRHQPARAGAAPRQRRARVPRRDVRPAGRAPAVAPGRRRPQRGHVGHPRPVPRGRRRALPPGLGARRRDDRGPRPRLAGGGAVVARGAPSASPCTRSWCT